jgi:long-chain acyl-CoA synthetase
MGLLDEEGYLHFLGRRKEMLKMRGLSVFPSEIKTLLGRHPAVAGSAVIGKSDPEKGEVPPGIPIRWFLNWGSPI